ncbi:hypothetical protein EG870_15960, partial [Enterococcus faecalis]
AEEEGGRPHRAAGGHAEQGRLPRRREKVERELGVPGPQPLQQRQQPVRRLERHGEGLRRADRVDALAPPAGALQHGGPVVVARREGHDPGAGGDGEVEAAGEREGRPGRGALRHGGELGHLGARERQAHVGRPRGEHDAVVVELVLVD